MLAEPATSAVSKRAIFGRVVRRAAPRLIEASLVPTAIFYSALVIVGLGAALATALLYTYGAILWRAARGRAVPPLLLFSAVGITVKTAVAVATDSTFLYFAQPVATSVLTGCMFLLSLTVGRPLVERLAVDFWPLSTELLDRPGVARLLRRLSLLWAVTNLTIGAATFTFLVSLPLPAFVAVKQVATLAITGVAIALTIDASVRTARREGLLHLANAVAPQPA